MIPAWIGGLLLACSGPPDPRTDAAVSPLRPVRTGPARHPTVVDHREVAEHARTAWDEGRLDVAIHWMDVWDSEHAHRRDSRVMAHLPELLRRAGGPVGAPQVERWLEGRAPEAGDGPVLYVVFMEHGAGHTDRALDIAQRVHQGTADVAVIGLTELTRGARPADIAERLRARGTGFPVALTRDRPFLVKLATRGTPWAALVIDGRLAWAGLPSSIPEQRLMRVPPR